VQLKMREQKYRCVNEASSLLHEPVLYKAASRQDGGLVARRAALLRTLHHQWDGQEATSIVDVKQLDDVAPSFSCDR
jgi:hypothetical protein